MWSFLTRSLRAKLVLFAALLVVVPGIVFAVMTIASARRALELAVGRQLAEVAHDSATEVAELIEREQREVQAWAQQDLMQELPAGDSDHRAARFLMTLQRNEPMYVALVAVDAAGRVVASSDLARIGTNVGDPAWLRATTEGRTFFAGPRPDAGTHRNVLEFAAPITATNGGPVIGALLGLYDWERITALLRRIQRTSRRLKLFADIALLDASGTVLATAPPLHGESVLGENLRDAGWRTARRGARFERPAYLHDPIPAALVGFAPMETGGTHWRVLVYQPLGEALAPIDALERHSIAVLGVVLVAALAVAWLFAQRLSRPLRELTRATVEVAAAGEMQAPVPVRSQDEIGRLTGAFNVMGARLRQAQADLVTAGKFAFAGEVAAGVAHEVRTPLGILRSATQLLSRHVPHDRPDAAELADMIVGEVDRVDRVVAGLLELTRPREPSIEPTPLAPLLARAIDFVGAQADSRHIAVRGRFTGGVPPALCDPDQIYQVALNLIVNALQVLPRGGLLTVRTQATANGMVGFEVADNGPGMSAEVQARIFVPYFTAREGGTGLGLALVQRIVQAHRGSIHVESVVGLGTTFRVDLPAAENDDGQDSRR